MTPATLYSTLKVRSCFLQHLTILLLACQLSLFLALLALPTLMRKSVGRINSGFCCTCSFQFKPTQAKALGTKTSSRLVTPFAITKSSALSCWSISHIASTYSGTQPQSLDISRRPNSTIQFEPAAIRFAAYTIICVTNRSGRKGDS